MSYPTAAGLTFLVIAQQPTFLSCRPVLFVSGVFDTRNLCPILHLWNYLNAVSSHNQKSAKHWCSSVASNLPSLVDGLGNLLTNSIVKLDIFVYKIFNNTKIGLCVFFGCFSSWYKNIVSEPINMPSSQTCNYFVRMTSESDAIISHLGRWGTSQSDSICLFKLRRNVTVYPWKPLLFLVNCSCSWKHSSLAILFDVGAYSMQVIDRIPNETENCAS